MIDDKQTIRFFKTQLNRCKINLKGAIDRKDTKAVCNIQYKMSIYQYTIQKLQQNSREE